MLAYMYVSLPELLKMIMNTTHITRKVLTLLQEKYKTTSLQSENHAVKIISFQAWNMIHTRWNGSMSTETKCKAKLNYFSSLI